MSKLTIEQVQYLDENTTAILEGKSMEGESPFDYANPLTKHGEDLMVQCRTYIEENFMTPPSDVDHLFARLSEVRARGHFGSPKAIDFDEGDQVNVEGFKGKVNRVNLQSGLVEVIWENKNKQPAFITPNQIRLLQANEDVIPVVIKMNPADLEEAEYTLKITGHDTTNAGVDKLIFGVRASNNKRALERAREIIEELGIKTKGLIDTVQMNTNIRMMMNRSAPDRVRWDKLAATIKNRLKDREKIEEAIFVEVTASDKDAKPEPTKCNNLDDVGKALVHSLGMVSTNPELLRVQQVDGNRTALMTCEGIRLAIMYRETADGSQKVSLSDGQVYRLNESLVDIFAKNHDPIKSFQECQTPEERKDRIQSVMMARCTGVAEDIEEMSAIISELEIEGGDVISRARKVFFDRHQKEPEVYGMRNASSMISEQMTGVPAVQEKPFVQFGKQAQIPVRRPVRMQLKKTTSSGMTDTGANLSVVSNFSKGLQTLITKARQVKANPQSQSSNRMLANVLSNLYYILMGNTEEPWNPLNTSMKIKTEGLVDMDIQRYDEVTKFDRKIVKEEEVFQSLDGFLQFEKEDRITLEEKYPGGTWINGVFGILAGEGMLAIERVKDGYFCHGERWGEGEFTEDLDSAMKSLDGIAERHNLKLNEISMPRIRRFRSSFVRSSQSAKDAKDQPANIEAIDNLIEKARLLRTRMMKLTGNPKNPSVSSQISLLVADMMDFLRQHADQPWNPMSAD